MDVDELYCTKSVVTMDVDEEEDFLGVIIVGAGPAGLAAAASIETRKDVKLQYKIIEKSNCIAPLWKYRTYDKLTLQREKEFCQLTDKPFPTDCRKYPTREDFLKYLNDTADNLKVKPQFNEEVVRVDFDHVTRRHTVWSRRKENKDDEKFVTRKYTCYGIIVASGRDADPIIPDFKGLKEHFPLKTNADAKRPSLMKQIHSRDYKNGEIYKGKRVLVVGCGDSGIDICGDLFNNGAVPFIVVKSDHKRTKKFDSWPKEIKLSELSSLVDNFGKCVNGIIDPEQKISIQAYSDIEEFKVGSVVFKYNRETHLEIDCVIMATGYTYNVREWCEDTISFDDNGMRDFKAPMETIVKSGVCAVGFNKSGLFGIKDDAGKASDYAKE